MKYVAACIILFYSPLVYSIGCGDNEGKSLIPDLPAFELPDTIADKDPGSRSIFPGNPRRPVKVHDVPLKDIEILDSGTMPNEFGETTAAVTEGIGSKRAGDVETVLYPMSGADSTTPFRLFRNARRVIGMGFESAWDVGRFPIGSKFATGKAAASGVEIVTTGGVLEGENHLLPRLIAGIRLNFPDMKLVKVELQEAEVRVRDEYNETDDGGGLYNYGYHARIQFFAQGEYREYIHICGEMPTSKSMTSLWFPQVLKAQKLDALIVKGAMDVWHMKDLQDFKRDIITSLRNSQGLILEDNALSRNENGTFGFSGDQRFSSQTKTVQVSTEQDWSFGYGNTVQVTDFR